jgi:hypothetical protein
MLWAEFADSMCTDAGHLRKAARAQLPARLLAGKARERKIGDQGTTTILTVLEQVNLAELRIVPTATASFMTEVVYVHVYVAISSVTLSAVFH